MATKQINVRADDESQRLIQRLLPAVRAALGLSRISQSDLFRLGLKALEKQYLGEGQGKGESTPPPSAADKSATHTGRPRRRRS